MAAFRVGDLSSINENTADATERVPPFRWGPRLRSGNGNLALSY